MPLEGTICHIFENKRILLKKATRAISKGKWNGPGGKIEPNETPEESAKREVLEETGLIVENLKRHGIINFYNDGGEEISFIVHVFSTNSFSGEIISTEEGEVRWFDIDKMPRDEMWDDDNYWLQFVLDGRKFDANFYIDKDKKVWKYSVSFK